MQSVLPQLTVHPVLTAKGKILVAVKALPHSYSNFKTEVFRALANSYCGPLGELAGVIQSAMPARQTPA